MISANLVRQLTLRDHGPLAAASGLVRSHNWLHVIADDSLDLATFSLVETEVGEPGQLHRLFPDPSLPLAAKERKKLKPDLESLGLVPFQGGQALLSLGSGSSPLRQRAFLQPLFPCGEVDGRPLIFDLGPLYTSLPFRELNIEGLAASGSSLYLGQRGNSQEGINALVRLDLKRAIQAIADRACWSAELVDEVISLDLGNLNGVPLTLTDLAPLDPDRLVFTAAAEDTQNPYDDGQVLGSTVGTYSLAERTITQHTLDGIWKVEGVDARRQGDHFELLLVTDADDPLKPALLLRTQWPGAL